MISLIWMLCIACLYDYRQRRIPNPLILLIAGWGLIRNGYKEMLFGVGIYILVSAVVAFLLYPLFRIGGLGAGDVKLMSVCAGFFPVKRVFYFLFISLLFSAVFSIVKLFRERNVRDRAAYLGKYCKELIRQGKWSYFNPCIDDRKLEGICMAGPVLCSVILRVGGVY